jgi:hypothetical protein
MICVFLYIFFKKGSDIMTGLNFYFDGESSEDYGIYLIRESNIVNIPYIPDKKINEEFPNWSKRPFFYDSKYQQYTIKLRFSTLENTLTDTKLNEIASWLFKNDYKEFYSEDNTEKIFYLMASSNVDCIRTVTNEGYFDVEFKSFYPYALTTEATPTYTITTGATPTTVVLVNNSNVYDYYNPEIEITVGADTTSISIVNTSDSDRTTTISGLTENEVIYIDNEKKRIISDTQTYPFSNFNKIWLRLIQGTNNLDITGNCTIVFRTQFPIFT